MSTFNKILCPVDMSENSLAAINLATTIARENDSSLVFIYVAPQWLSEGAMVGSDYIQSVVKEDKKEFEALKPCDPHIEYEHIFKHGNAGPEIVRESRKFDMVVMSTHGHGAVMRLLMGSVAQYTMRNAKCPVVLFRNPNLKKSEKTPEQKDISRYVTEFMHQVHPVHEFDKINEVLVELDKADDTAAPVINDLGKCIGILTKSDIANYRSLLRRFEEKDKSVVDEMFEVDKYGQYRAENPDFDQVKRHMSSPVVTIANTETTQMAAKVFAADQSIHHLVVVDESQLALGIIEPSDCNLPGIADVSVKPTRSN